MQTKDGKYIGTYNGGQFWVTAPAVEDISLEEITHALAYNVRFNGHTDIFWSIAQHSLLVETIMIDLYTTKYGSSPDTNMNKACLAALSHDFSEGYMSDIARPFKKLIPDYLHFEGSVQYCINKMFKIDEISEEIKSLIEEADTLALAVEANTMLNPCNSWINDYEYMSDARINKYKNLVKSMCPDIVQSLLLYRIFYYMQLLNIENKHKNNDEMRKMFLGNNEYSIIKNGTKIASFDVDSEHYKFKVGGGETDIIKTFKHSEIDNIIDIRKLL